MLGGGSWGLLNSSPRLDSTPKIEIPEGTPVIAMEPDHVHIEKGEYILFSGHSKLPEGTYLQTQLYIDGQPEPWPTDKYIKVRDGKWQIKVRLGENGAPQALLVGPDYVFKVWQKGNPSVSATMPFDLVGPPTRGSENETENDNGVSSVQEPVEIVSVVGPLEPNPGGPVVGITLKNVAAEPVISLTASLELSRAFEFIFDVTSANPLLPGQSTSIRRTLITGGFTDTVWYPLAIVVKLRNGEEFAYTKQVRIAPPPNR